MTLEELLNKCIQRGWLPFGEGIDRSPYYNCDVGVYERVHGKKIVRFYSKHHKHPKTLRQLVSKESGLWQFVCENGFRRSIGYKHSYFIGTTRENIICNSAKFRLIESALCDEDKLEEFLLNSIKLD